MYDRKKKKKFHFFQITTGPSVGNKNINVEIGWLWSLLIEV